MLAIKGDRLTSGELRARFGVTPEQLKRWFDRGWVSGVWANTAATGRGGRLLWEPWVARVVPHLLDDRRRAHNALDGANAAERRRQLEALARALASAPDAPWFVWDDGIWLAVYTAADVVDVVNAQLRLYRRAHRMVVSLPPLDD